jgi:hypothetical protein
MPSLLNWNSGCLATSERYQVVFKISTHCFGDDKHPSVVLGDRGRRPSITLSLQTRVCLGGVLTVALAVDRYSAGFRS